MMGQSQWVHLEDCEVKRVTDKALLVEYDGEEVWLPISQVSEGDKYEEGDVCTISVTEWIAKQKGWKVSNPQEDMLHKAANRLHHLSMRYAGAMTELSRGQPVSFLGDTK